MKEIEHSQKTEYVPLSSFEFKNTRIADSASHGDKA